MKKEVAERLITFYEKNPLCMAVKDQGLRHNKIRIMPNRGADKQREKKIFSWTVKE